MLKNFAFIIISILFIIPITIHAEPVDKKISIQYDDADRISAFLGPGKRSIHFDYSQQGLLSSIKTAHIENSYEYNRLGHLKRIKDRTGTTSFKTDEYGRIVQMIYPSKDNVLYSYYEDGSLATIVWKDQHSLLFTRDLLGNTISLQTPQGTFTIQYDYDKRIMIREYPNKAVSYFEYNDAGRPVFIQHALPDNKVFAEFNYQYNSSNVLIKATEKTARKTVVITYTYDEFGQLTKASYTDNRVYTYLYDSFGNRLECSLDNKVIKTEYNKVDEAQSFNAQKIKLDIAGNVIDLEGNTFTFNDLDQLEGAAGSTITYNALGYRASLTSKNIKKSYIHLIDNKPYLLGETGDHLVYYYWADGVYLGQVTDKKKVLYYFEDQTGSIRFAMDIAGNIAGEAEYTPFGIPITRIPEVDFGFTGEEQDSTGLMYLRTRYYIPQTGRFLSVDPVSVQLMDDIKQNKYAYAGNNPVNYKDSMGSYPSQFGSQFSNSFYSALYDLTINDRINADAPLNYGNEPYTRDIYTAFDHDWFLDRTYVDDKNWAKNLQEKIWLLQIAYKKKMWSKVSEFYGPPNEGYLINSSIKTTAYYLNKLGSLTGRGWQVADMFNCIPQIQLAYELGKLQQEYNYDEGEIILNDNGISAQEIIEYLVNKKIETEKKNKKSESIDSAPNKYITRLDDYANPYKPDDFKPEPEPIIDDKNKNNFFFFPPPPPPGGGNSPLLVPDVGGVYLNKAAEIIGNLDSIDAVTFDPVSNRIILVSEKNKEVNLPGFSLDDFAAAFRSIYGNYELEPGVTIDPDPANPRADNMLVRFFGGVKDTHFGYVLFEADRVMKNLSLGKDNITKKAVTLDLEGYYNLMDLAHSDLKGNLGKDLWSRFWLVPERVIVRVSDDGKSIDFPDTRISVKTETMKWENGKLVPAIGEIDEKAEYFSKHFTAYYDDYGKQYPIFAELKRLTNLVALAKWLKESKPDIDLSWLDVYAKKQITPVMTPSLTVTDTWKYQDGGNVIEETLSLFGGVDFAVNNNYIKENSIKKKPVKLDAAIVAKINMAEGIASDNFIGKDGIEKNIVALPTSGTKNGGAKMITESELLYIDRVYCSFHNNETEIGRSWRLNIPHLRFIKTRESGYLTYEDKKTLKQRYELVMPFGIGNVVFDEVIYNPYTQGFAAFPIGNDLITGLYPDDKADMYCVGYKNGDADYFDSSGKLIKRIFENNLILEYIYNTNNLLTAITAYREGKKKKVLSLEYDTTGRLKSADVVDMKYFYKYDGESNLAGVSSTENTIIYGYNDKHLLVKVNVNGKDVAHYTYDDYGRVLSEKGKGAPEIIKKIENTPGGLKITNKAGDETAEYTYDRGGRLKKLVDTHDNSIEISYYENGGKKEMTLLDSLGSSTNVLFDADGKYVQIEDAEGNIRGVVFDEYGRVKQIQNDKNALVIKEYGVTDLGFIENTETPGLKSQQITSYDNKPLLSYVQSKMPGGGEYSVEYEYTKKGEIKKQQVKGLTNSEIEYNDGKVISITSDNKKTGFIYDKEGKIIKIKSEKDNTSFMYDKKGDVSAIDVETGNEKMSLVYQEGKLTERKKSSGVIDKFIYSKEGVLKEVKRGKDEHWKIYEEKNSLSIERNGVKQQEIVFDKNGRIKEIIY